MVMPEKFSYIPLISFIVTQKENAVKQPLIAMTCNVLDNIKRTSKHRLSILYDSYYSMNSTTIPLFNPLEI